MSPHDPQGREPGAAPGHGPGPVSLEDVLGRIPGRASPRLRVLFIVLVALGALTFFLTLVANPQRAWTTVLINVLYWLPLSQSGVLWAAVFVLTRARWAVPVHRIALGMATYAPWMLGVLAVMLVLGNVHLFPWVRHPVPANAAYLNLPFLLIRDLGLVGAAIALNVVFRRRYRRLDAGLARGRVREDLRARYEKWSAGWKGDAIERADAARVLPRLAGAIVPVHAITYTVLCWDLVMSLDPTWSTTQIAPWFWIGGLLSALAMISVLGLWLRGAYRLEPFYDVERTHQQGRLLFGFTNFRSYLSWVLFLPIWYGNMPEESSWMVRRVHFPYAPWLLAAVFFGWFVPLIGFMNLATKKRPGWHIFFAASMLLGMWIEQLVLVYPSLYVTTMPFGVPEIGVGLAFLGGFALCFQQFAATRPLVALDQLEILAEPFH